MTRDEKVSEVARRIAQGGWSSIYSLVDDLSDLQLSYWFEEDDEDLDEEENNE